MNPISAALRGSDSVAVAVGVPNPDAVVVRLTKGRAGMDAVTHLG